MKIKINNTISVSQHTYMLANTTSAPMQTSSAPMPLEFMGSHVAFVANLLCEKPRVLRAYEHNIFKIIAVNRRWSGFPLITFTIKLGAPLDLKVIHVGFDHRPPFLPIHSLLLLFYLIILTPRSQNEMALVAETHIISASFQQITGFRQVRRYIKTAAACAQCLLVVAITFYLYKL